MWRSYELPVIFRWKKNTPKIFWILITTIGYAKKRQRILEINEHSLKESIRAWHNVIICGYVVIFFSFKFCYLHWKAFSKNRLVGTSIQSMPIGFFRSVQLDERESIAGNCQTHTGASPIERTGTQCHPCLYNHIIYIYMLAIKWKSLPDSMNGNTWSRV